MKKTLACLAVLGAFAGSAAAADVSLYGIVDTGLMYKQTDTSETKSESTFGMNSGINSGSRFGLTGKEDLGNGLTVGFKLENGFQSDSGNFKTDGKLFDREASLHVYTGYGTFSAGRMGALTAAAGTYDIVAAAADVFDGGDNNVTGQYRTSRFDNVLAYQTPEFAGVKATAMYSFETDSSKKLEGDSNADRYAGLALQGTFGPANLVASYELMKLGNGNVNDDQHLVTVGGNFDLQVTKLYALAQYTKGARTFGDFGADEFEPEMTADGIEAYGVHFGADTPIAGGNLKVGVYYLDGEGDLAEAGDKATMDLAYYGVAARYVYPLSKRTSLYAGAGYAKTELDENSDFEGYDEDVTQAYFGLTHKF